MDGESEECVGRVLKNLCTKNVIHRKDVCVVSKFGYIQGQNMKRHLNGHTFPETVAYARGLYHCIHPAFMADQLTRTLERMQQTYIDVYLLHNPEYFIIKQIKDYKEEDHTASEIDAYISHTRSEMLTRISKVFEALEVEIHTHKRIRGYGISSNSFSLKHDDPHFLPYEDLISMSRAACKHVCGSCEGYGLSVLQMPANLVETYALTHAVKWACETKLCVLINRPLNAIAQHDSWRLADAQSANAPKEFAAFCAKLISEFAHKYTHTCECVQKLCAKLEKCESVFEWQSFCHAEVITPLQDCIAHEHLCDQDVQMLHEFVAKAEQNMKYNAAMKTRKDMNCKFGHKIRPNESLQEFALNFLLNTPGVTCVLLGCRTRAYVDNALDILDKDLAS